MHSPLPADVEKLSPKAILAKQQEFLWPSHLLYYKEPLALDHGNGSQITDVAGKRYLDFFGGILTHPKWGRCEGVLGLIYVGCAFCSIGIGSKREWLPRAGCANPILPTPVPKPTNLR